MAPAAIPKRGRGRGLIPRGSILTPRARAFAALYLSLIAAALLADLFLHRLQLPAVGRHLGWIGAVLLALSFVYSLRKRRRIRLGSPRGLLRLHEFLAWTGALAILVHAGIHLHALLPWAAVLAMLVTVASGVVGRSLLADARRQVAGRRRDLREQGLAEGEIARALFFDALTVRAMEKWRSVHFLLTVNFAVLALAHVATALLFG